jgi:TPR repeat protein
MFENITSGDPTILLGKASESKEKKDYTNYFIHLTMACNLNNKNAIEIFCTDSVNLFHKQDFNVSRHFYQETIKFPYSANNMGFMYEYSLGVIKNPEKAIELYQYSVDQGIVFINNLAICYRDGIGTKKDINKAIKLYKENGSAESMHEIGFIYEKEHKNIGKAIKYYEKAVKKGDKFSLKELTALYRTTQRKSPKIKTNEYVINYYVSLGKEKYLSTIFGYSTEHIQTLIENFEMRKENESLKKENREMKNHIMASPDGPLYFETLGEWKKRLC